MERNVDIEQDVQDLRFGLQRSARYHSSRRRFFTIWSRWLSFISVVASAGAIVSLLSTAPQYVTMAVAGIVAVAQSAELVFALSEKAMRHEGLYRDSIALEARLEVAARDISEERLTELRVERLRLEAGEPPVLRWLDVLCHNELAGAMGHKGEGRRVSWLQRKLAHYVDLTPVHDGR